METKIRANLDTVNTPQLGSVSVSGWSYLAGEPSVATANSLMAQSSGDGAGAFTASSSEFSADRPRPDVAAAFPGVGSGHGYTAVSPTPLRPGPSVACVAARRPSVPTGAVDPWAAERCVYFEMPNALGALDSVTVGEAGPGTVTLRGWAVDPTSPSVPVAVEGGLRPFRTSPQTFVDAATQVTAVDRPDVNALLGITGAHGFEIVATVPAGFTGRVQADVQLALYASQPAYFASFAFRYLTIG